LVTIDNTFDSYNLLAPGIIWPRMACCVILMIHDDELTLGRHTHLHMNTVS